MNMRSSSTPMEIAVEIIAASSRERPADRVMKDRLRDLPPTASALRREISEAVFAWFKWCGWYGFKHPNQARIQQALDLHRRFQSHPEAFDADLLRQRVIPSWANEHVDFNDGWVQTLQQNPRLWLRSRRGKRASLTQELGGPHAVVPGVLEDALVFRGDDDLFRTEAFHRGKFEIQDISSQAVGLICAPRAGESWWDACAGEGGKTLHLSDLMFNRGLIWATDPAKWRLAQLQRRAARAGMFNYRAVLWRPTEAAPTKNRFDGVLVDAPCSGSGTWQRNPHARWTTTPDDVCDLARIQMRLLTMGAESLKPGGKLIYSVCTLTREETDLVADGFFERTSGLEILKVRNPFEPSQAPASKLWLWPQQTGGNGMFIAAWRRSV